MAINPKTEKEFIKLPDNKEIKCNIGAFVVPNPARLIEKCLFESTRESWRHLIKRLEELNDGLSIPEDTYFVELWLASDELECKSLTDHTFYVEDSNGVIYVGRVRPSYFPKTIFDGRKEGDTFNIKLPAYIQERKPTHEETRNAPEIEIVLNAEMKLSQCSGRYWEHGTFEKVLEHVCNY